MEENIGNSTSASSVNRIVTKIITKIKYLCPSTTPSATTKMLSTGNTQINTGMNTEQNKRLISQDEQPLTLEDIANRELFATVVAVCFSLSVLGIVLFVTYNHLRSKWDIIRKEEEDEDGEEENFLAENNNGKKVPF